MFRSPLKDDFSLGQRFTSVVFENNVRIDMCDAMTMVPNLAHNLRSLESTCNPLANRICVYRVDNENHSHSQVEGSRHFTIGDVSCRLNPIKLGENRHRVFDVPTEFSMQA